MPTATLKKKKIGASKMPPKNEASLRPRKVRIETVIARSPHMQITTSVPRPSARPPAAPHKSRKGVAHPGPVAVSARASGDRLALDPEGTYQKYPILAELPALVTQQRLLHAKIASVAADILQEKAIREQIEMLLMAAGVDDATCGDFACDRIVKRGAKKIVAEKLLEHGVPMQTIADSTVEGEGSSYVVVKYTAEAKKRLKLYGQEAEDAAQIA